MLIVLILISIVFIILSIFMILSLSTLRIYIKEFKVNNVNKKVIKYLIYINIHLLNKMKLFSIKIDNKKINKVLKGKLVKLLAKKTNIELNNILNNPIAFLLKERKRAFNKKNIEIIKKLDIKLLKLDFKLDIGCENVIITSYITAFLSSIIAIILTKFIDEFNSNKHKYIINPSYNYQNFYNLTFNCIISLKMVHIMNIIYISLKERGIKEDGRASNRRTYGYGHE